ncbi:MAG: hypothetical protein GX235_03865 [Clostridiales bacterium]|nr:hypothetical protein [Clostridiales bacterium]
MCYLIAKKFNEKGCIAVESKYGPALASLVSSLSRKMLDSDVQILTISSKEVFGEYAPFHILETEEQFVETVLQML